MYVIFEHHKRRKGWTMDYLLVEETHLRDVEETHLRDLYAISFLDLNALIYTQPADNYVALYTAFCLQTVRMPL